MKRFKIGGMLCFVASIMLCKAQEGNIDAVLASIAKNNKALQAYVAGIEVERLGLKASNNLNDPQLKYDYMAGKPATAGNQTDVTFTQELDFPAVYASRRKLTDVTVEAGTKELNLQRQQVLLQAKLICLELIYRNKLKRKLQEQEDKYKQIEEVFKKNLQIGTGNAVDVNKARVQVLELAGNQQENEIEISRLNGELMQLNGGQAITFSGNAYKPMLMDQREAQDTVLTGWNEALRAMGEQRVALAKKGSLPKIEVGYHYQGVLDQNFHGGLLGLSIPLWSNRHKVNEAKAQQRLDEANFRGYEATINSQREEAAQTQRLARTMMRQYEEVLESFEQGRLLDKAFAIGEMPALEYFLETSYFHNLEIKYLGFELDYNKAMAVLNRSQL